MSGVLDNNAFLEVLKCNIRKGNYVLDASSLITSQNINAYQLATA
jgi:anti-sigma28 factor (negative regulator of flagellin synthesis)